MLANYFAKLKNNERTLVFVAFTAEEIGGFGSQYFSKNIDPDKVAAMFNLEMIGTESKWGKNSAYITGFEKSDFGKILQKNLQGTVFHFEPDPYTEENLFYRSDNATLAALGVPAHTISTSKMDNEPNYHKLTDDVTTLDMKNMTEVIKAIALSAKTIISGKDTPTRVEKMKEYYNFSISTFTKSINTFIFSGLKSKSNPAVLYNSGKVLVPPRLRAVQ
jgi:putative aminopeptidase FrvX